MGNFHSAWIVVSISNSLLLACIITPFVLFHAHHVAIKRDRPFQILNRQSNVKEFRA